MTLRRFLIIISICVPMLVPSLASAQVATQDSTPPPEASSASVEIVPVLIKPAKLPAQVPLDDFWDRLAWCETHGNWKNGGNWAGGLGIARSTWKGFGGEQFGRTPDRATREEQIIVANRIALFGWQTKSFRSTEDRNNNKPFYRNAVGFGGWGALPCAGGRPHIMKYEKTSVLAQKFKWGQRGRLVKDLQAIIKAPLTARYDERTWGAHQKYMVNNSLDVSLVPRHGMKKAKNVPSNASKHCQEYAQAAIEAGFPKYEVGVVTYVAWKESRCTPDAVNLKDEQGGSFGLMQINNVWTRKLVREGIIKSRDELYNPKKNLRAAFFVWTESIRISRYGWKPWRIN
jgi:hypothetical protein